MDFSSGIIIDFGLNLAGYMVVTLLVYVLAIRQKRPQSAPAVQPHRNMTTAPTRSAAMPPAESAFVSLASTRRAPRFDQVVGDHEAPALRPDDTLSVASRRENRRAIYREARQLLARGQSQGELLARLPLTEDEIEMLSMAGNA